MATKGIKKASTCFAASSKIHDDDEVDVDEEQKKEMSTELCRVCKATGAGRHYGSFCCSGCKGFFRRSVRFQKLYRCPYEAKCVISKLYRNCCRACRFQKCLSIGLDPNLVHGDWGQTGANCVAPKDAPKSLNPNNATDFPSSSPSSSDSLPNPLPDIPASPNLAPSSSSQSHQHAANLLQSNALIQHNKILNSEDQQMIALGYNNRLKMSSPMGGGNGHDCLALSEYFIAVERLCDLFVDSPPNSSMPLANLAAHPKDWLPSVNLEVPVGLALKQPGKVSPRFPMNWSPNFVICKTMLQRVYCRVMVHYFDWASHVPELAEFDEEDRQTLIVKRAMRCIWLLCAFRSASLNCQGIVGSCQMMFPYGPEEQEALEPEFKELFSDTVNLAFTEMVLPFRQLHVSEAEYALLRVLCLFNPVSRLSEQGRQLVLKFQAKYLNALSDLQVAQLDDNAFSMLNVFNLAGMRGTLTYEMHVRAQEELGLVPAERKNPFG